MENSKKYIVGLCGTHGTGKSTILQGVKLAGCASDETQLSRKAQAVLCWKKLSIAQESVENMWALQDAILCAMFDRDVLIERSRTVTIVERTPADVWAYTEMWCNRLGINYIHDTRAMLYKARCRSMAQRYAKFLMVPPIMEIPFVVESNRADLASRAFVDSAIGQFLWDGALPFYLIKSSDKDCRVAEAIANIDCIRTL